MDRLTSMEVFVAVVEAGSLSAAAKRFGLSAPMVGKHLQHLEQRLGARLLTRTTRRQSLTEVGRHYLERCKEILADVRAAEAGAEALRAAPRGRLRVAAPVSFGAMRMAPALADFLAAWPELSVELALEDRVVDLVEEGFDVAVRIGRLKDSEFIARPLQPYGMCLCATPAYLARAGTPRTPDELARHQRLGFTHWNQQGDWSPLAELMQDDKLPSPRLVSNHGGALHMAVLQGAGIALLAEALVAEDLRSGRLVRLLQAQLPPPRPMHLVYPRDRQPVPKLRTFVDFMLDRFGAAPGTSALT
ncbi:LysR family transcriptional regulator [Ideonella sp.]|uniref:LysR family transcriptional regulator n=1 Tax=Ideonella sp. TaxID=1929293 RepID=UPI002B45E7B2|nr:LysR family transcriptional regulator [Ideonella sp.]HJV71200.1 LysR family transcriptional regulator [Ideonella sp.]